LLGYPDNSWVAIYTPGWREALWELSVLPKNTTQCPRPGLEPGSLALETSTLIVGPLYLPEKTRTQLKWLKLEFSFLTSKAAVPLKCTWMRRITSWHNLHCVDVNLAKILKVHYKQYSKRKYIPITANALVLPIYASTTYVHTYMSCVALFNENNNKTKQKLSTPSILNILVYFLCSI